MRPIGKTPIAKSDSGGSSPAATDPPKAGQKTFTYPKTGEGSGTPRGPRALGITESKPMPASPYRNPVPTPLTYQGDGDGWV